MRINVIHALPYSSSAYGQDDDGFTAAMRIIAQKAEVRWINVHPANHDYKVNLKGALDADFILVRSDWGWYPDALAGPLLARSGMPCGLIIAGSHQPPSKVEALRYNILFYETPWYEQFTPPRPRSLMGLGINTDLMSNRKAPRDVDWLFVGRLAAFKRPLGILGKTGHRIVVGDLASAAPETVDALTEGGVELIDHVSQEELANWYNRSKNVLVPCELQGGGERAVLEGRSCGCNIEVADDNPKLQSLLTGPIMGHEEYSDLIWGGILYAISDSDVTLREKRTGERVRRLKVFLDKVKRSPDTIKIRSKSIWKQLTDA